MIIALILTILIFLGLKRLGDRSVLCGIGSIVLFFAKVLLFLIIFAILATIFA